MDSGPLAGFPVVDVCAVLIDGSYHDVDSSALAFQVMTIDATYASVRVDEVQTRTWPT